MTAHLESPKSLESRHQHWLAVHPHDGGYRVLSVHHHYEDAMAAAIAADHPDSVRASVALYTRDYYDANGLPGLRRDGLARSGEVEIVSPATVTYHLTREQSEDPLALLAVYAGVASIRIGDVTGNRGWGDARPQVRVSADAAAWYTMINCEERVHSTLAGWWLSDEEVARHRGAIAVADERASRAQTEWLRTGDGVSHLRALDRLLAVRRAAGEYALAGAWAK